MYGNGGFGHCFGDLLIKHVAPLTDFAAITSGKLYNICVYECVCVHLNRWTVTTTTTSLVKYLERKVDIFLENTTDLLFSILLPFFDFFQLLGLG